MDDGVITTIRLLKIRHVFDVDDQRSSGFNPVRLATLANMRGPISS
jgi:hypothetical protein